MAGRSRKEYTPAPPLILMPAGGGLTFIPPDHPNILMPVIQPTLPDAEIDAESDSFVGQSSSFDSQVHRKTSQIQTGFARSIISGHEPFAHVGQQPPSVIPTFTPIQTAQRMGNGTPPPSSMTSHSATLPPVAKPISSSNTSGTSNMYRHQGGRPQYAVPPIGPQPSVPGFSHFTSPSTQTQTATVPPLSSFTLPNIPPNGSVQSQLIDENINVQSVHNNSGHYTGGLFYQPVRHHWCYQQNQGDFEVWRPFSVLDSMHLEVTFNTCLHDSLNTTMILTNGGRYDVNVGQRLRTAVYWSDEPVPVRRCSWFYKRESDHRYIPYEEDLSVQLENEYKKAMETGGWHRRLEFPGGVVIVMENTNEVVQLLSSSQERCGNVQGEKMRPRVVKRGVESFATIEYGERDEVDHLVFVVPGIEDTSNNKGKSVEAFVDDLRSNALALLNSHFSQAFQSKSLNRVEFLPVMWTQAFQDRTSVLNKQVERISLPSTPKLRHLTNNTLTDALFYTSPLFCQKICEMVGSEMNRMFHIFLERNKSFSGDVSVAGHSLGSVILFDLLLNQRLPGDLIFHSGGNQQSSEQISPPLSYMEQDEKSITNDSLVEESTNETEVTLESLLSRIGLQDKVSLFQQEQIDVDSLIMCSEQDLKDIGLPMGPRKKILNFLEDEKKGKDTTAKEQNEGKIVEELDQKHRAVSTAMEATLDACSYQDGSQHFTAKYTQTYFGAGQLKIVYPRLDFTPSALFAFGSPIAVFLSLRGVQELGELFQLPTCPRVFNIFHPFDPVAYRLEPLIRPQVATLKPVQVPHYKGRKRLHLEFKEAVTRYGTDIKQKIVDSFKSTWNTINDFTRAYKADTKRSSIESEVQAEMNQMMSHIAQQHADDDVASVSSVTDEEINDMGHLNDGQRVDYVLQEGPLESFNDYIFALDSHSCYWESEDTALMLLKEIYSPLGFRPVMPGEDALKSPKDMHLPPRHPPPPVVSKANSSYPISPTSSFQISGHYQTSQATFHQSAASYQVQQTSFGAPPPSQTVGLPPPSEAAVGIPPPLQIAVGLPPPMFSLQSQMFHGPRRSPYVVPDFSNLPPSQNQGIAGPPPIQPGLPQGYRKGQH